MPLSCGHCQKPFRNSIVCIRHSTCIKCLQFFCSECLIQPPFPGFIWDGGFTDLREMGFLLKICPRCVIIMLEYPIPNQILYGNMDSMTRKEKDLYCLHQLYLSLPLY
jgi:hypothetical protein